jgi:hypothetical protein
MHCSCLFRISSYDVTHCEIEVVGQDHRRSDKRQTTRIPRGVSRFENFLIRLLSIARELKINSKKGHEKYVDQQCCLKLCM